jgi:hypothetical protein
MPVGVDRDRNARMPQLLGHILDRGMVLIELDRCVAMLQIMDAIALPAREPTRKVS